jgi:putative FmdB family regulatory protein
VPLYEYKCQSCGKVHEVLVYSYESSKKPSCPDCGSDDTRKLLSVPNLLTEKANNPGTTCCGRTERCDKPPCSTDTGCRRK